MYVFQASYSIDGKYTTTEHETAEEAIALVEADPEGGSVVKFILQRNMPHCLPEFTHHSLALWVYEGGKWTAKSIFGGSCESMGEEKPH